MRPASIRILGKKFSVAFTTSEPLKEDLNGECDTDQQRILVRDGMPLEGEQDVLLHECLHAIDEMVDSELTESQVKRLATGLLAVLKDNPRFISYLRKR